MAIDTPDTGSGPERFERSPFSLCAGSLCVKLAESAEEIEAAQRLRYAIFYGEKGAVPSDAVRLAGRDFDAYDQWCDHLLVLDVGQGGQGRVVGTYRLLRRSRLPEGQPFYSESEFDITPLKRLQGDILELGRSCVQTEYRGRSTMQLLWRGIGEYVTRFGVEVMFGCASFTGTDPDDHADELTYLHRYHLAPPELRPRALPSHYESCDRLPADQPVDSRAALREMPALVKGYLRLNGYIGDGAYVDAAFNTVDVCIVVKTNLVTRKYADRYNPKSGILGV